MAGGTCWQESLYLSWLFLLLYSGNSPKTENLRLPFTSKRHFAGYSDQAAGCNYFAFASFLCKYKLNRIFIFQEPVNLNIR
jgi:hypothetical protein